MKHYSMHLVDSSFHFRIYLFFINLVLILLLVHPLVRQANVYHATKTDGQELAIKVYKTSVLVFKYVSISVHLPQLIFSFPLL